MRETVLFLYLVLATNLLHAQHLLPYSFINNSPYPDSEIYIGLVGKFGDNIDVWMDMNDYSLVPMSADQNTLDGPEWSTPASWKYPDIFTKLSDVTDNTVQIPQGLYGCRIFISFEAPMYLHFHETGGYAGANLSSSSDPNSGIRWEIVELTWGDSGLWTNSSRVDAYQYPISVEVAGFTGGLVEPTYEASYLSAIGGNGIPKYEKIGEKLPHEEILSRWDNTVSDEYLVAKVIKEQSIDGGYIIEQPSKVEGFPEDIFDEYIEEIWSIYTDHDLVIDIGDRGIWTGRVSGDRFDFVDPVDGSIASIYGKPTSFNAIEGSGFLAFTEVAANVNQEKHDEDLMIQAQIAAAINRHAIYTEIIDGEVQFTHDASRYFIHEPYNEYVSFFHNEEISYESQTYAFAYDDVGDHSSTLQSTFPTRVRVIIGGYNQYIEPMAELALLTVAPYQAEVEIGEALQFSAQGYDQYSAPFPTDITWTTTVGGIIDDNGLFTATTLGIFTITAQDGIITRSTDIVVTDAPGITGCEAVASNGDYSYLATDEPSLTFIPAVEGNGSPVCLLYYKTDTDNNFTDAGVDPNIAKPINASTGDTVYFYYTYSLSTGGENNTSNALQTFVVGDCSIVSSATFSDDAFKDLILSPNPSSGEKVYLTGITEAVSIDVFTLEGSQLSSISVDNMEIAEVDISNLSPGLYLISVISLKSNYSKTFKLHVN